MHPKRKNIMRYFTLILLVVVIGYLATSAMRRNDGRPTNIGPQEVVTVLRPVPAILNEDTLAPVDGIETKIKGKHGEPFEFKRAQFINENHGWTMSSHELFRTVDGGKSWEGLPLKPEKDARFIAFSFVDESRGWLAMVKDDWAEHYGVGTSSVIMVTDNGGNSWELQASFHNEVQNNDVQFLNESEGLAVGYKGLDNRVDRIELFVVSTSNGGKQWQDISGPAKAEFKNQWGQATDSGTYIQWSSSKVYLLTQGGRVMHTADRGKTWNTIAIFNYQSSDRFNSSIGYYKLALDPENRIRVLAGKMGDEGYQADFVVNEDGRWTSHEVELTPILDAVFLSDKDVVACGLNVRSGNERPKRFNDAGIILRSFDGGKSWQSIYRSKTFETFFFITKVKDNTFYAVSDIGTFLRFTLPQ